MSLSKDIFPLKNNSRQLPYLSYQPKFRYHTSAVLASAIDMVTLPWRSRNNRVDMTEVVNKLNVHGRKIAATGICMPFPLREREYFVEFLDRLEAQKDLNFHQAVGLASLTPGCHEVAKDIQVESLSLRGMACKDRFKPSRDMRSTKMPIYTGRYALVDSISGAIFSHFAKRNANPARNVAMPNSIMSIDESLPTSCPFPHIFNKNKVSNNGLILDDESSHNSGFTFMFKYHVIY